MIKHTKIVPLLCGGMTRRVWLATMLRSAIPTVAFPAVMPVSRMPARATHANDNATTMKARAAAQMAPVDPAHLYALAQRAVDAALSAGASYADTRLTRTIQHQYGMINKGWFQTDDELVGVGVRVLVNGCWGFAASPEWTDDEAVRLATSAVSQARANALGTIKPVELSKTQIATGTWATPVKIDPFTVPIEEKLDAIVYWKMCAEQAGIPFTNDGLPSGMGFTRQDRVLVTSEGTRITQTRYESGGAIRLGTSQTVYVPGLETSGSGWELFTDANLEDQFLRLADELRHRPKSVLPKPLNIGRYTVVYDGATMAAMLNATLGLATQLDRALGYEANAGGTSFVDDPLGMLGHFQVAAPTVTVTTNRSTPRHLATVRWDEEGTAPVATTLINNGVLVDFQTTREQATWLGLYYTRIGRPVQSNGCAVAEDALAIPLQQKPNLVLQPNPEAVSVDTLIANVKDGLFVEGGDVTCDFQGRNGLIVGNIHEIKNGRLGKPVAGGSIIFNSLEFWKHITALGGTGTRGTLPVSQYGWRTLIEQKGQPPQRASYSVMAPAAIVTEQTVIDPSRKA